MLRSIRNAASLSRVSYTQHFVRCKFPTHSVDLHQRRNCHSSSRNLSSMTDVLSILGPLDHLFPTTDGSLYVRLLRKCIKSRNFIMGGFVHGHLIKLGFESDLVVSNVLLDVYAKVGSLGCAVKLFDEMPNRDSVSWCTVISGFVARGFELEGYVLFRRMLRGGVEPNHFVISSVLKGCSEFGVLEIGLVVHSLVIKGGLGFDRFIEIGLVAMYAKCSDLADALRLFREIPVKNTASWNAIISGYVQNGCFVEAAELCLEMCRVGFVMDLISLRVVASAAAALEMSDFCKNVHVYSIKVGLDKDGFIVAELVKLFCKIGKVSDLGKLFDRVKKPDSSLYSLLISGYNLYGRREEALRLGEELLFLRLDANQGSIISVLNVCRCKKEGAQLHGRIIKTGHVAYLSVGNALISLYIRLGEMAHATDIFFNMSERDVVSWTAVMAGLVKTTRFGEALDCFQDCWRSDIELDHYSIVTAINACAGLQVIDEGRQIHALALKLGFTFSNFLNASLIHMYARCVSIESSAQLFSSAPFPHDLILTNIMLAGYCWNSLPNVALDLFKREYGLGLVPDKFSFSTVLGACADIGTLEVGKQLHCSAVKIGFDFSDAIVGNAIINMYITCGCIACACKFFYSTKKLDINRYAVLMSGYIQERGTCSDLHIFRQMQQTEPSSNINTTFARILKGCIDVAGVNQGKHLQVSDSEVSLVPETNMSKYDSITSMVSQDSDKKMAFKMDELFSQEYYSFMDILNINDSFTSQRKKPYALACVVEHGLWLDVSVGKSVVRRSHSPPILHGL